MATANSCDCELSEETIARVKAELVETDGEPLESPWHRAAINLLIDAVTCYKRDRTDYFVGGNMFIYYSQRQSRERLYRGPDFFYVKDVDGTRERLFWWVFEEDGRFPDIIIELQSPSTAEEDRTTKKDIYEKTFRTPEYFLYDPDTRNLLGWRLTDNPGYQPIAPNERGWLWSEQLGLWLATWEGSYLKKQAHWPRFYDVQNQLILTEAEQTHLMADNERQRAEAERQRAEAERERAEAERKRAEAAEAELTRLKALLAEKGIALPNA